MTSYINVDCDPPPSTNCDSPIQVVTSNPHSQDVSRGPYCIWIEWLDHLAMCNVYLRDFCFFSIFSWLTSILDMSTKVISWVHYVRSVCCSCLPRWRKSSSCYWCQSSAHAPDISAVYVYLSEGSVVHVFHTGVSSVYVNLNDLNIVHGFLARVSIGIIPWQTFLVVFSMSWSDFCV